jgi:hypothetical protein
VTARAVSYSPPQGVIVDLADACAGVPTREELHLLEDQ